MYALSHSLSSFLVQCPSTLSSLIKPILTKLSDGFMPQWKLKLKCCLAQGFEVWFFFFFFGHSIEQRALFPSKEIPSVSNTQKRWCWWRGEEGGGRGRGRRKRIRGSFKISVKHIFCLSPKPWVEFFGLSGNFLLKTFPYFLKSYLNWDALFASIYCSP